MTKICGRCKAEKSIDDFYKKKTENSRIDSWCKECLYAKQKLRWIHRKKKAIDLLGGKCSICGYRKNFSVMHFHHIDPTQKEYDWKKIRQLAWGKLIKELQKCVLLCSNCHGEIHNPTCLVDSSFDQATPRIDHRDINVSPSGNCPTCNALIFGTKYCSSLCSGIGSRKVERPTKSQLENDINSLPMVKVGEKYGVSDNAVRKWARNYGIL
jgi:hypothetical protein